MTQVQHRDHSHSVWPRYNTVIIHSMTQVQHLDHSLCDPSRDHSHCDLGTTPWSLTLWPRRDHSFYERGTIPWSLTLWPRYNTDHSHCDLGTTPWSLTLWPRRDHSLCDPGTTLWSLWQLYWLCLHVVFCLTPVLIYPDVRQPHVMYCLSLTAACRQAVSLWATVIGLKCSKAASKWK